MTLTAAEYDRAAYLLGKHRLDRLSETEREELRTLLARETPLVRDAEWDALVQFGLTLFGAYRLAQAIDRQQA